MPLASTPSWSEPALRWPRSTSSSGKDRLVADYLYERDRRWRIDWETAIAAATFPRLRVGAIFDALERWWTVEGHDRGCAQVDTIEITNPDHPRSP